MLEKVDWYFVPDDYEEESNDRIVSSTGSNDIGYSCSILDTIRLLMVLKKQSRKLFNLNVIFAYLFVSGTF